MKKTLFLSLITVAAMLSGCKEEFALPVVTSPATQQVEVSSPVDITFGFTAEAGFSSATVVATGGTATIKTNGTAGSTSGNVVVTFTAGAAAGAGSVTLTVKDTEAQANMATAVLTVFELGAPAVTAPASTNVEVLKPVDISFNFTAAGGYSSATVTVLNGTAVVKTNGTANATTGTVVVTYTAARTTGAGSVTLNVKDSNNKTGVATAVLDVKPRPTISVTANITANTIWETGKIYILEGRIAVLSGATLTIQKGVIIKGQAGSDANASALLIARGAKIEAVGTATEPIIFTSIADQILPGELVSPNLQPTLSGLWGGLLVLGKAKISADAEAVQIEGIPASDLNGLYGGTDDADNSGTIKYVSIRHGGANIGEGNEINGLTLGGVGSGTVIENVEIVANQDDGIEWFGGAVNVTNALVWNAGDDGVDTDQAWAGTLDNFIVICGVETDHALEIDGPEGSYLAAHTVKNGSLKGNTIAEFGDFRAGARGAFQNLYFFGFPNPADPAGEGDLSLSNPAGSTITTDNFAAGILSFSNLQATPPTPGVAITLFFRNGTDVHASLVTIPTTGADKAPFSGWSWAANANQLTSFSK